MRLVSSKTELTNLEHGGAAGAGRGRLRIWEAGAERVAPPESRGQEAPRCTGS